MSGLSRRAIGSILCLVAALALVVAGCGGSDSEDPTTSAAATEEASGESAGAAEEAMEVSFPISFHRGISWAPLVIAEQEGYFEDENLDVNAQETNGSSFVTQQVIAGNFDYGWAGADSIVIAADKVPDLRVIMCKQSQNIFRIMTPVDSDIQSVADLAGRKLGFTEKGGGEEPLVNSSLADAGVEGEVELLPVGDAGPQVISSLESGAIDAYASSYPDMASLAVEGVELRDITPDKFAATPGDCLFGFKDVLVENADELVKVGKAFSKGAVTAIADPAKALDIVCEVVPEDCENREFAKKFMDEAIALYPPLDGSAAYGWRLSEDGWQTTADTLLETGTIESEVDVDQLIADPDIMAIQDQIAEYGEAELESQS